MNVAHANRIKRTWIELELERNFAN